MGETISFDVKIKAQLGDLQHTGMGKHDRHGISTEEKATCVHKKITCR